MRSPFIELSVVAGSSSAGTGMWTALVRRDQITAVEDVSARNLAGSPKCRVTLAGPVELVDVDEPVAAAVGGYRDLLVKQDLATIKAFLETASDGCGCCG